jgi:hypothetical protein
LPTWRVERSEFFMEHALAEFPRGRSAEGRPSFDLFEEFLLTKVERVLSEHFEAQMEAVAGVRFVMTHGVPFVPACVIYAAKVGDHVELLDITVDWDYWETIGDDPGD